MGFGLGLGGEHSVGVNVVAVVEVVVVVPRVTEVHAHLVRVRARVRVRIRVRVRVRVRLEGCKSMPTSLTAGHASGGPALVQRGAHWPWQSSYWQPHEIIPPQLVSNISTLPLLWCSHT